MLSTVLSIFVTTIQQILNLLTCLNILKIQIPFPKIITGALLIGLSNVLPIYYSKMPAMAVFLLCFFWLIPICLILFKLSMRKTLAFIMTNLLFSVIVECSMIMFDTLVISRQGFFFSNIRYNSLLLLLRVISLIPCVILYKLSDIFISKTLKFNNLTQKSTLIIVLNTLFLILFICPNVIYFEHLEIEINNYILVYNVALVLIFLAYGFYNSYRAYQYGRESIENENRKVYTETLGNSLDQIKGFRHEMNNIISTIAGFVELERLDLLRPYIGDLQQRLTAQSSTNVLNLNLREVPILYGLLIGKVNYATNMGVRFEIAIVTKEEIVFPNEVLYDLAYIMGVWLDNAIEAAAASELKQVNLLVRDDSDCYNIVVRNSFEGEVDLEKIKRKNYSTKSNHMGIGLHQVEEKVQAQSKYFSSSTTINECSFIQHLQVKK